MDYTKEVNTRPLLIVALRDRTKSSFLHLRTILNDPEKCRIRKEAQIKDPCRINVSVDPLFRIFLIQ